MKIINIKWNFNAWKEYQYWYKQIRKIEQQILFKITAWKYYNTRDHIINLINRELIERWSRFLIRKLKIQIIAVNYNYISKLIGNYTNISFYITLRGIINQT